MAAARQRAQVVLQQRRQRHALEPTHSEHDQAHDTELGHEAREGGQAGTIVGQPDERQGHAAQQDRGMRARAVAQADHAEPESDEHREGDRGPPAAWHDPLVRRARVRPVEEAPAPGGGAAQRRRHERHGESRHERQGGGRHGRISPGRIRQ